MEEETLDDEMKGSNGVQTRLSDLASDRQAIGDKAIGDKAGIRGFGEIR